MSPSCPHSSCLLGPARWSEAPALYLLVHISWSVLPGLYSWSVLPGLYFLVCTSCSVLPGLYSWSISPVHHLLVSIFWFALPGLHFLVFTSCRVLPGLFSLVCNAVCQFFAAQSTVPLHRQLKDAPNAHFKCDLLLANLNCAPECFVLCFCCPFLETEFY